MEEQQTFNFEPSPKKTGPVTCLGLTFEDDLARREHFKKVLAEKLKDPAFRNIEGFPKGTDEDILALSDPPYYCACPNPWINDFIKEWESEKAPKPLGYKYEREPFAADVSEGKNDPIYNAHSYHTKVPHKAIMRYILHYTEPGDIVFDGFCGTGMTGVAAQLCGDIDQVRSLGYRVDEKTGAITDPNAEDPEKVISYLGARKAVLNDLSPAASFIAYNYNTPVDIDTFEHDATKILNELEEEYGWMYETQHVDKNGRPIFDSNGNIIIGKINYVIWSDVFLCPHCQGDVIFWEAAVDMSLGKVKDEFECPACNARMKKRKSKRLFEVTYDSLLGHEVSLAKQVPILINYTVNGKRFEKRLDESDKKRLFEIENKLSLCQIRPEKMPDGANTRQPKISHGIEYVHQFYTHRTLNILSYFVNEVKSRYSSRMLWLLTSISEGSSKLNRERPFGLPSKLNGTLYVSSTVREINVLDFISRKIKKYLSAGKINSVVITTQSTTGIGDNTSMYDYIFLDPPFGANINYSELSFNWESWLGVKTDTLKETIVNTVQNKELSNYQDLMTTCFNKVYKLLKPGRWITIEFSNTSASVWNSIQSALSDVGFIIASVTALDKQQGSFKAVTTPTAVKQDLVITAYKPDEHFEARFKIESETVDGVWDFIRTHLSKLPICKVSGGRLQTIPERDPRILYDQVISYYVRKNINVPISSRDFQDGLVARYSERDGRFFLPEQAAEYDRKKARLKYEIDEDAALFIQDEASAISWLRSILIKKPQTYSSIHPQYLQAPMAINKYEDLPDLGDLLKENFLCYDAQQDGDVPSQIHTLLSTNYHELRNLPKDSPQLMEKANGMWYVPDPNKAGDIEKLRERSLLKEFETYRQEKKLKKFRLDAIRVGCKKAFTDKNFAIILEICEKIPEAVINEDDKLLMWYNIAQRLCQR